MNIFIIVSLLVIIAGLWAILGVLNTISTNIAYFVDRFYGLPEEDGYNYHIGADSITTEDGRTLTAEDLKKPSFKDAKAKILGSLNKS